MTLNGATSHEHLSPLPSRPFETRITPPDMDEEMRKLEEQRNGATDKLETETFLQTVEVEEDVLASASKVDYQNVEYDGEMSDDFLTVDKSKRGQEIKAIVDVLLDGKWIPPKGTPAYKKYHDMVVFVKKFDNRQNLTLVFQHLLEDDEWQKITFEGKKQSEILQQLKNDPELVSLFKSSRKKSLRTTLFTKKLNPLAKFLTMVNKNQLKKIVDIKKSAVVDLKEVWNARRFADNPANKKIIEENPFIFLADLNKDGTFGAARNGSISTSRVSEEALYDIFLWKANKEKKKDETGKEYYKIKDGEKTKDLVAGFQAQLEMAGVELIDDEGKPYFSTYTLKELSDCLWDHPEWALFYQKQLDQSSYNATTSINDLVTKTGIEEMGQMNILHERSNESLNTINSEYAKWFTDKLATLKPEERERFEKLDDTSKRGVIRYVTDMMDKIPAFVLGLAWLSVTETKLTEKQILSGFELNLSYLGKKNDPNSLPRLTLPWNIEKVVSSYQSTFTREQYHNDELLNHEQRQVHKHMEKLNPFKKMQIGIDIPIVNLTGEWDVNRRRVQRGNLYEAEDIHKIYARIGANVNFRAFNGDVDYSPQFRVMAEGAVGWRKSKVEGIETKSSFIGQFLKDIFTNADFTSKDKFQESVLKSFREKTSGRNAPKEYKNYLKHYPGLDMEISNFITNVGNSLSGLRVFDNFNRYLSENPGDGARIQSHSEYMMDGILKGIIQEIENENMHQVNGRSQFSRFGVFAQAGVAVAGGGGGTSTSSHKEGRTSSTSAETTIEGPVREDREDEDNEYWRETTTTTTETTTASRERSADRSSRISRSKFGMAYGIEMSVASRQMLYAPDKEKYNYMDESLKKGTDVKPISMAGIDSDEKLANCVREDLLGETNITELSTSVQDGKITISITPEWLQRYHKKSLTDLFNVYVKPGVKNIAYDQHSITIGNVDDLNVSVKQYFNDKSLFLFIGGKGVDGCENNKLSPEAMAYDSNIEGFEFTKPTEEKLWQEFFIAFCDGWETADRLVEKGKNGEQGGIVVENGELCIIDQNNKLPLTGKKRNVNEAADGTTTVTSVSDPTLIGRDFELNYHAEEGISTEYTLEFGKNTSLDAILSAVEEDLQHVGRSNPNDHNQFLSLMNEGNIDAAGLVLVSMLDRRWSASYYVGLKNKLINPATLQEEKMYLLCGVKAILATSNVRNKYGLNENLKDRKDRYKRLNGFPSLDTDYRQTIVDSLQGYTKENSIPVNTTPNLFGYTAFYRMTAKEQEGKSYSMTTPGNTKFLGDKEVGLQKLQGDDIQKGVNWMRKMLDERPQDKEFLKNSVLKAIEQQDPELVSQVRTELNGDNFLEYVLWEKTLDIGSRKITIEKEMYFYLLAECANESLGMQITGVKIEGTQPVDAKGKVHVPQGEIMNANFGRWGDALTGRQATSEKQVNAKISVDVDKVKKAYEKAKKLVEKTSKKKEVETVEEEWSEGKIKTRPDDDKDDIPDYTDPDGEVETNPNDDKEDVEEEEPPTTIPVEPEVPIVTPPPVEPPTTTPVEPEVPIVTPPPSVEPPTTTPVEPEVPIVTLPPSEETERPQQWSDGNSGTQEGWRE